MSSEGVKECPKCGAVKSRSHFYGDKSRRGGLTPRCKQCINADNTAYKEANREKVLARRRDWHARNAEKIEAQKKASRCRNRDKIAEYNQNYHQRMYGEMAPRKRATVQAWRENLSGEKLARYQQAVAAGGIRYRASRKGELATTRGNLSKITGLPVELIDAQVVRAKADQLRVVRFVRKLKRGHQ